MVTTTNQPLSSTWNAVVKTTWDKCSGTWEQNAKVWKINITESISFTAKVNKRIILNNPEKLNVKITYLDNRQFVLRVVEQISFISKMRKWFYRIPHEALVVSEKMLPRLLKKTIKRKITCTDIHSDHRYFSRFFEEQTEINDKYTMYESLNKYESIGIQETKRQLHFFENARESLIFSEIFDRKLILTRVFSEAVPITDKVLKDILKPFNVNINIVDSMLQKCDAILSDIIISNVDIPTDVPADYEPWRPFVSGDYTYKDALIKCKISALKTEGRLLLSEYKIFVDLPDIQDHDVTKIEAKKTWIPFTLDFYQIPEVTITMVSGGSSVLIPYIVDVDLSGFYVELRDSSGNLSAGTISWQALGC